MMLYTCITYESRHEHGHYPTETVADRGEAHRISCATDIRQTTPGQTDRQTDRQTDGWLELRNHERNHGEKLYGISRGVDVDPLPFPILSTPFPVSRCCSTHVSPISFSTLLFFSTQISKEVRGSGVNFPRCPVGRDGSHGSRI